METPMISRPFGFVSLLAITAAVAPAPVSAQDEALRGKTAMSVYVSVYGDNEIYSPGIRLALEQQLHDIGITVLPHGDPPNYPVLNLTIKVETREVLTKISPNKTKRATVVDYTNKLELRQLAPGRTPEMRPIEDVAIWTKADP